MTCTQAFVRNKRSCRRALEGAGQAVVNREPQSTDARHGGGAPGMSDEAIVMVAEQSGCHVGADGVTNR